MSKERARRRAERERERALAAAQRERRQARARRRAEVAGSVRAVLPAAGRRRVRWRGAGGPLADRRRSQNRLIALFFLAVQALVWLLSPSWAVRVAALVLSLLLLPVFVTLIYDRRS